MVPHTEYGSILGTDNAATVPAVERALDVLELLAASDARPTLTEIASRLGMPKGSAHRLMATLSARGYVSATAAGRGAGYALGPRLLALATRGQGRTDVAQAAREPLHELARATGEGCQLSVRSGDRALVLLRVPSPSHPEVSLTGGVGASFPLHAVAVGKALLAFAPAEDRDRYLREAELAAFTPDTRTDATRLAAELDAIRAEGIARDEQEYKRGLRAFAAPVFGADGAVAAAIALPLLAGAAPADDARLERDYIAALRDAARATTRNLGGG